MAAGSAIKHHEVTTDSDPLPAWRKFLEGGPTMWARDDPPEIGSAIHQVMHEALRSADPMENLNVQYLMWRRSLDPPRFDHYHPNVGRKLEAMLTQPTGAPTSTPSSAVEPQQLLPTSSTPGTSSSSTQTPSTSPSTSTSPETGTSTPGSGASPSPAAIPEPGTFTIGLLFMASALCWRRYRDRAPRGVIA